MCGWVVFETIPAPKNVLVPITNMWSRDNFHRQDPPCAVRLEWWLCTLVAECARMHRWFLLLRTFLSGESFLRQSFENGFFEARIQPCASWLEDCVARPASWMCYACCHVRRLVETKMIRVNHEKKIAVWVVMRIEMRIVLVKRHGVWC